VTYDLTAVPPDDDSAYRRLLEAIPVTLWTANAAGEWTHVNSAWVQFTGVLGESRGFGFESVLHPEDEARTLAAWRSAVACGEDYEIKYRLRHHSGAYRWFLIRGVPVPHDLEVGQSAAWVGTGTDI
jgi:PAS domain S-box-containing protein